MSDAIRIIFGPATHHTFADPTVVGLWQLLRPGRPSKPTKDGRWTSFSDRVASGQTVRVFTVVEDHTRERLAMDTSPASERVVGALDAVISAARTVEKRLFVTTGWSSAAGSWKRRVSGGRSGSSSSSRQADPECVRGELQRTDAGRMPECQLVCDAADARRKILDSRQDYNPQKPHSALGYRTPTE